ncbi:hypothetical protein CEXT_491101 [Caerostris extrusa]|uniref:Uncharacterized protein n=1 Tax=Caerostris extrusa TaxID=172846 RepID=A0AAV4VFE3_CAEEX|nr:hypothetical protein CEXT_491101 [Caerostris extrusa]
MPSSNTEGVTFFRVIAFSRLSDFCALSDFQRISDFVESRKSLKSTSRVIVISVQTTFRNIIGGVLKYDCGTPRCDTFSRKISERQLSLKRLLS